VGALISNAGLLARAPFPVVRGVRLLLQRQHMPALLTGACLSVVNAWSGGLE
jgi:hypothetical protein